MATTIPVRAGGDINPARFVTLDTTANNTVLESNAGDEPVVGISNESTKNAPQAGGSSLHAAAGDQARIHPYGEDCLLEIGTGGCTAGDYLKPDADGKGVTAATADDLAFAITFETAAAAEKAKVLVISGLRIHV